RAAPPGARSGTGRTPERSGARRVRRSPRRPGGASTHRASGGTGPGARPRRVGREVQVGAGGVDRDATAVVLRRRLVVRDTAPGERDLLRLHADGSERRVAVPRTRLAEVEEREAVRVRDERPAGVVPWEHHPVAGEGADHAGRDGLEPGRPSHVAELHGAGTLILRRARRGEGAHAGGGGGGAPV